MNHSPAYIIAQYFIDEGLLVDPSASGDWPVYVGVLPDENDVNHDAVGSIDTAPVKDGRVMEGGEVIFHEGVQLLLRATAYNSGYAKMNDLKDALELINRDTITISSSSYRLDNITLTSGIVTIAQEDGSKRRSLFSLNFLVTLKEV